MARYSVSTLAALAIILNAGVAHAMPPVEATSHWLDGFTCYSPGDCTYQVAVAASPGYDDAEVFLQYYYIDSTTPGDVWRIKLEVTRAYYKPENGDVVLDVVAALDTKQPTGRGEFEFGVGVVVLTYMDGSAAMTDPDPSQLKIDGSSLDLPLRGQAIVEIDPSKKMKNPTFLGFMIRGFEFDSMGNTFPTSIMTHLIDVTDTRSFPWMGEALVNWNCALEASMATNFVGGPLDEYELGCRFNLVGVAVESDSLGFSADRQHGPSVSNGFYQNKCSSPNCFVAMQKAWAFQKPAGNLTRMSGGGLDQTNLTGHGVWYWDASNDGVKATTRAREVVMKEVDLF